MTWFKVDDGFWSHPKTLPLNPSAVALWVRAGAWSCQHLTDGFVPSYALPLFGSDVEWANALVDVGYWDEVAGGYEFHDWDDYQESSEEVKVRRSVRSEASAKANHTRWHERPGVLVDGCKYCSESESDSESSSDSDRNPPDPTRPDPTSSSTKKRGGASRATRIPEPFIVNTRMREWAAAEVPGVDVDRATRMFVDHFRAASGPNSSKKDWVAAWRNWLRKDFNSLPPTQRNVVRPPKKGEASGECPVHSGYPVPCIRCQEEGT